MGKIIGKGASVSVDVIKFLMRGRIKKVPRMEMKCVDVHDVAQAHVRSLLVPEAANQRFIIVHKALWMNEIAEILGISCGTVKSRLARARTDMKKSLVRFLSIPRLES